MCLRGRCPENKKFWREEWTHFVLLLVSCPSKCRQSLSCSCHDGWAVSVEMLWNFWITGFHGFHVLWKSWYVQWKPLKTLERPQRYSHLGETGRNGWFSEPYWFSVWGKKESFTPIQWLKRWEVELPWSFPGALRQSGWYLHDLGPTASSLSTSFLRWWKDIIMITLLS